MKAPRVALVYIHVLAKSDPESREPSFYYPYSERFFNTYFRFKPEIPHELHIVFTGREPCSSDRLPGVAPPAYQSHVYTGRAKDIGAWREIVRDELYYEFSQGQLDCDFALFCPTTVYFWKRGWMERLVRAWQEHGDGLYAPMASYENSPHIRTSCFGCRPGLLNEYPTKIDTFDKTVLFESCHGSFTEWVAGQGKPTMMVTWNECLPQAEWRKPANIFRRGDQSNCMTWDRHVDEYRNASPEEKAGLEAKADGK